MSIFLSIEQVATLLCTSERSIQRHISAGKYTTQQVPAKGGKGGVKYEIALTTLPKSAQERYKTERLNQQLEVIYGPEKHSNNSPHVSQNGRDIAQVAKGSSLQVISTPSGAIDTSKSGIRQPSRLSPVASGRLKINHNGRRSIATTHITGAVGCEEIGAARLSDAGSSRGLAANQSRGATDSSSDNTALSKASDCELKGSDKQRDSDYAITALFAFIEQFDGTVNCHFTLYTFDILFYT